MDQTSENMGKKNDEEKVLQFLDALDNYLILYDSLSSTLRQGWLELASARHSMGSSRITSALFDLKLHHAATNLQVKQSVDEPLSGPVPVADSTIKQPHFTLSKWEFIDDEKCDPKDVEVDEESHEKNRISQLRRRGPTVPSEFQQNCSKSSGSIHAVEDQVKKERSKSLSVFGALVSPKLRESQISFETALETLVQIANARSLMLSAFTQLQNALVDPK